MSEPETRWTAETEHAVFGAIGRQGPARLDLAVDRRDVARIALAALADAGLLLPPGGEQVHKIRTLTTWRWTAETEALVVRAIEESWNNRARRSLAALADAGLLLPPGGEQREEHTRFSERAGDGPWRKVHRVRTVTTWPDGMTLAGPWIEASS